MKVRLFLAALALVPRLAVAQGLDAKALRLFDPPADAWPTYNGDYSGRRYSPLKQINASNLGSLALAWMYRIAGVGPQRGVGNPVIKSTPLMVNGVLYFTIPDHVFAVNARTGEAIWQYDWEDHGGHLVGNRGVGMYGRWLYFLGARRLVHFARRRDRQGALAQESSRRKAAIFHHHGADGGEESRACRR